MAQQNQQKDIMQDSTTNNREFVDLYADSRPTADESQQVQNYQVQNIGQREAQIETKQENSYHQITSTNVADKQMSGVQSSTIASREATRANNQDEEMSLNSLHNENHQVTKEAEQASKKDEGKTSAYKPSVISSLIMPMTMDQLFGPEEQSPKEQKVQVKQPQQDQEMKPVSSQKSVSKLNSQSQQLSIKSPVKSQRADKSPVKMQVDSEKEVDININKAENDDEDEIVIKQTPKKRPAVVEDSSSSDGSKDSSSGSSSDDDDDSSSSLSSDESMDEDTRKKKELMIKLTQLKSKLSEQKLSLEQRSKLVKDLATKHSSEQRKKDEKKLKKENAKQKKREIKADQKAEEKRSRLEKIKEEKVAKNLEKERIAQEKKVKQQAEKKPTPQKLSAVKKAATPKRQKTASQAPKMTNLASLVKIEDKDLNFKLKQHLVEEFATRWWYALPPWPPAEYNYEKALDQNNLRQVDQSKFKIEPEEDKSGKKKAYEVDNFSGVFKDSKGKTYDLRPKESCPSLNNFLAKETGELQQLLNTAYKAQLAELTTQTPYDALYVTIMKGPLEKKQARLDVLISSKKTIQD